MYYWRSQNAYPSSQFQFNKCSKASDTIMKHAECIIGLLKSIPGEIRNEVNFGWFNSKMHYTNQK